MYNYFRQALVWFLCFALHVGQVQAEIFYIHSDHLNTPRLMTNSNGQTIWQNLPLSEPFGASAPEEDPDGDGVPFVFNLRFPGQYYDQETNTHYNYYRDHYFPSLGRYGQSDPIGLLGGINTYAYAGGNPVSYIDPDGRWVLPVIIGASVVALLLATKYCISQCGCEQYNPTAEIDDLDDECDGRKKGCSGKRFATCMQLCFQYVAMFSWVLDPAGSAASQLGQEVGRKIGD